MISIKVDENNLKKIKDDFSSYIFKEDVGYILYVIKTDKNIITAFDNKKKASYKVTIQGENGIEIANKYATEFLETKNVKKIKENPNPYFINIDHQIGSDEVGTGDFLGPIVVCAAYCNQDTMKLINKYNIKDSKKLNDQKILEIVPLLVKKTYFEYEVFSNERYNEAVNKGYNLNSIKCVLHNYLLTKLHERFPYVKNIYIDEFTPESNYYNYLKNVKRKTENIIFQQKGETYYPSIALASCIARYIFLTEIENLSKKYNCKIPLGASKKVDEFSIEFIKRHGLSEFKNISKNNFANYKTIIEMNLE